MYFVGRRLRGLFFVALLIALSMVSIYLWYPSGIKDATVELIFTILGTILAIYFTLEVILPFFKNEEKKRLISLNDCVDFYNLKKKVNLDFFEIKKPEKIGEINKVISFIIKIVKKLQNIIACNLENQSIRYMKIPKFLPVIFEYRPRKPVSIEKINLNFNDKIFSLPIEIQLLLEPIEDDLKTHFQNQGYYNSITARLDRISKMKNNNIILHISKTSYYRTFITNFFADYPLFWKGGIYLRETLHNNLFINGKLRSIHDSNFSNQLGIGGFIISKDGKTIINKKNSKIALERNQLYPSFGRGIYLGKSISNKTDLYEIIKRLIKDDVGIEFDIKKIYFLGIIRTLLWMGKPDIIVLVIVDSIPENNHKKIDKFGFFGKRIINCGIASELNNLEDVVNNKYQILGKLYAEIEKTLFVKPSISYLTSFYVLDQLLQ